VENQGLEVRGMKLIAVEKKRYVKISALREYGDRQNLVLISANIQPNSKKSKS
jgi:hypothetical protein